TARASRIQNGGHFQRDRIAQSRKGRRDQSAFARSEAFVSVTQVPPPGAAPAVRTDVAARADRMTRMRDELQIALEHHRAGRLRQAEDTYRQLLARDSEDADALHWLGALLCQAGQGPAGAELLERAVALRPDDAA